MSLTEKYRDKFIALLKEAEDEIGEDLTIKVSSKTVVNKEDSKQGIYTVLEDTLYGTKNYEFELHTNSFVM